MDTNQKIFAVLGISLTGLYPLAGWNISMSAAALEMSNNSLRASDKAIANQYSPKDAKEDFKDHKTNHREQTKILRRELRQALELQKSECKREIHTLPRPPEKVTEKLSDLELRVNQLESKE